MVCPCGRLQVGNHITDRPSSRVTAPPGGASQVDFGGYGGGMNEVGTHPVWTLLIHYSVPRQ